MVDFCSKNSMTSGNSTLYFAHDCRAIQIGKLPRSGHNCTQWTISLEAKVSAMYRFDCI